MSAARDTAWGPMEVHRVAAREAAAALAQAGFALELHEPNLPWLAPEGEAKELVRRAKEEDAEPVWRGDAYLLLAEAAAWPGAIAFCCEQLGYTTLYDLTAFDRASEDPQLRVVVGLRKLATGARLVLQLAVPKDAPTLPSVAAVFPAADWHEREAAEMYGLTFAGHPDPRKLLLPDDWVGHPLRKDYVYPEEYHGISCT